ncbi:MAG: murein transglycosylase A [Sphingomicrobium sp.]
MRRFVRAAGMAGALLLAACATQRPTPPIVTPPVQPLPVPLPPANAVAAGVVAEPPRPIDPAVAERALAAFRLSCPVLVKRIDPSGLTQAADWAPLCAEAATLPPGDAVNFFHTRFAWLRVGDGKAFATGYYEPEIRGSRTRQAGYDVPVYGLPAELVKCTRADGTSGRGMLDATGACVAYPDRAAIEDGAIAGRGLEIAWAADPVELFFVEVQGSGRLALPDGGVMRIGYAGQNGRDYVAIGKLLRQRNLLAPGKATMAGIVEWIRTHTAEGKALMRENPSFVFFREVTGAGPLGSLGVTVTPRSSIAADPKFIPLGAPVLLELDRPEANGLWIAQDVGGAIKGSNRVDTFWGAGAAAQATAGGMSASGRAWVLVPRGINVQALGGAQTHP